MVQPQTFSNLDRVNLMVYFFGMTFGTHVRAARKKQGLTLDDCASDLDVSPSFLAAVERGVKKTPTWMVWALINILALKPKKTLRLWLEEGPTVSLPKASSLRARTGKNGLERVYDKLTDAVQVVTEGVARPDAA
jgi:DNA-binding transcriptional regulator YiaG